MSFSEWKEVSLGKNIDIIGGGTPKTRIDKYWNGEIPWLSVKDFNNENRYVYETEKTITDLGLINSSTKLLKRDDIIISARGTVGEIAMLATPMAFNQSCYGLRGKPDCMVNDFLYYLLEFNIKNIQSNTHGSVFDTITRETFDVLTVSIPPLIEQKTIAATLSCLDDKIELNNRINKTLEKMAQAIFKSWFVDFEPFQDGEFIDSELGRIPKGWSIKRLYNFADYINGTSFKKNEYAASGCPIVKIVELKNGITESTEYFSGTKDEKYYIKTGDILFSWSGNPQTSIDTFIWVGGDAILNQHTFKISIINNNYSFIYLLLKYFKPEFTRIASSKQTTGLGHVTIADLKRLKFSYNSQIMNRFCTYLDPIIQKYINNLLENAKLRDIRDSLLPKLMSGEIRVPIEEVQ